MLKTAGSLEMCQDCLERRGTPGTKFTAGSFSSHFVPFYACLEESMHGFPFFWSFFLFFFPSALLTLTRGRDVSGSLPFGRPSLNETSRPEDVRTSRLFKEFVKKHNKTYIDDPEEYSNRLAIFKDSLVRHAKLNAREKENKGTALYGVNQFSDWTPQEFKEFLRRGFRQSQGLPVDTAGQAFCCSKIFPLDVAPPRHDWTKKGKVTAVKNQGKCGSCWAFTASECVESQWAIAGHPLAELSVQELISCSKPDGCAGGNTLEAIDWLRKKNATLVPASEFPYVDKETTCKTSLLKEPGPRIRCGCSLAKWANRSEEKSMKPVVGLHGPLGINVDATMWHDYLGGIIQHHCTGSDINHAVQITGYDFNEHIPYWIVRNSWGPSFGDKGYLYIKMGDNLCGLASEPSFVII